jgi:hypothetical protein
MNNGTFVTIINIQVPKLPTCLLYMLSLNSHQQKANLEKQEPHDTQHEPSNSYGANRLSKEQ